MHMCLAYLQIKIHKKEEQIKQLENDKGDLATKLEATIQETDNIKQTLQREHQQIVDQLHVSAYICVEGRNITWYTILNTRLLIIIHHYTRIDF